MAMVSQDFIKLLSFRFVPTLQNRGLQVRMESAGIQPQRGETESNLGLQSGWDPLIVVRETLSQIVH